MELALRPSKDFLFFPFRPLIRFAARTLSETRYGLFAPLRGVFLDFAMGHAPFASDDLESPNPASD